MNKFVFVLLAAALLLPNAVSVPVEAATDYAWQVVSESGDPTLNYSPNTDWFNTHADGAATVEIKLRNTGTKTWYSCTDGQPKFRLGTVNPLDYRPPYMMHSLKSQADACGGGIHSAVNGNRLQLFETQVAPGATGTFTIPIYGLSSSYGTLNPGIYNLDLGAVLDGIDARWLTTTPVVSWVVTINDQYGDPPPQPLANWESIPESDLYLYQVMETTHSQRRVRVFGSNQSYYQMEEWIPSAMRQYDIVYPSSCSFIKNVVPPAQNSGTPLWIFASLPDDKFDGLGGDVIFVMPNTGDAEMCAPESVIDRGVVSASFWDYLSGLNGGEPETSPITSHFESFPTPFKFQLVEQTGSIENGVHVIDVFPGLTTSMRLVLRNRSTDPKALVMYGRNDLLPESPPYRGGHELRLGTDNPRDGIPSWIDPVSFIDNPDGDNNRFAVYNGSPKGPNEDLEFVWNIKIATDAQPGVYPLYISMVREFDAWAQQVDSQGRKITNGVVWYFRVSDGPL
jgi:hypothetical protein